jgi:hypothetical protein
MGLFFAKPFDTKLFDQPVGDQRKDKNAAAD